jgi:hypothetical protein
MLLCGLSLACRGAGWRPDEDSLAVLERLSSHEADDIRETATSLLSEIRGEK